VKKGGSTMPVTPTYPGVYVQEVPSGERFYLQDLDRIQTFIAPYIEKWVSRINDNNTL
jgi:hypothetical protein